MNPRWLPWLALSSALSMTGCGDSERPAPEVPRVAPAASTPPSTDVEPSDAMDAADTGAETESSTAPVLPADAIAPRAGATIKSTIGMELVEIFPGQFLMGSPESEEDRAADENQVVVTLTKTYLIGKTEVTQSQWRTVMGTTPWSGKDGVREGDGYPATFVSWVDAQAFCKKLAEMENKPYRLPTEAEWECACRGGATTRFCFGDDESELEGYAWNLMNAANAGEKYAHEVGLKKSNAFGLFDMHGNVWEWCEDAYSEKLPGGSDPRANQGRSRVFRGGGWKFPAGKCRSATRLGFFPDLIGDDIGFRVALDTSAK